MIKIAGKRSGLVLVAVLLPAACADPDPPDPRDVAVEACEQVAVRQYDLRSAEATEVRELPNEEGDAFEVVGELEESEWQCTWTWTRAANGDTTTEVTIDTR